MPRLFACIFSHPALHLQNALRSPAIQRLKTTLANEELSNKRILVTGGAGFIGSHLCEALLRQNVSVTTLDNFDPSYPREEKERNLAICREHALFSLTEGDVRNGDLVRQVISDVQPEVIVHLAARAGVRPSLEHPDVYADVNVNGTTILLEAARQTGVRNVVFASSSSVYGNSKLMPLRETQPTDIQASPYGATKKAGELLCRTYHHLYGTSISCLRFFTVYGPRQRPDLAIRKFVHLALNDQEIPIYGDGTSSRDYTHIHDILTGILGAIRWGMDPKPKFGIFNLGSSHPIIMQNLLRGIEKCLGKRLRRKHLPAQAGDVYQTYADVTRAKQELGFRNETKFSDGLAEFIEWMKIYELEMARTE